MGRTRYSKVVAPHYKCWYKVYMSPYLSLQEVCNQYWPSSGSQNYGEFTVEMLGEESLQGFMLRTVSVQDAKVSSPWLQEIHSVW